MSNYQKLKTKNLKQQKIIVICGPTGSGKTSLAIELCQEFNGAIISADSRQVYRGMDIGTGKGKKQSTVDRRLSTVCIYGYDIVKPDEEFSVSHFEKKVFEEYLPEIWKAEKIPFLVGGTGLYIKAIIDGIETLQIPPNQKLRQELNQLVEKKGIEALWERLNQLNQSKANEIDLCNPYRLIRAIEIAEYLQKKPTMEKRIRNFEVLFIGLDWEREKLYQRIDQRIDGMIREGLLEEIKGLLQHGYSWNLPAMKSIGYLEFQPYFEKKATLEECVEKLKFNTHAYVRRQMTWFRKEKRVNWIEMKGTNWRKTINLQIEKFLSLNN